jgi:hypothetical protein
MKRLDLDDLPPRVAALLTSLAAREVFEHFRAMMDDEF